MAFPLAVNPLRDGDRLYADGGLVDPLPVTLARELSHAPVVAVNTGTGLSDDGAMLNPYTVANQAISIMTDPLLRNALAAADFVCEPDVAIIGGFGFASLDTLLSAGYAAGWEMARAVLAASSRTSTRSGGRRFYPLVAAWCGYGRRYESPAPIDDRRRCASKQTTRANSPRRAFVPARRRSACGILARLRGKKSSSCRRMAKRGSKCG